MPWKQPPFSEADLRDAVERSSCWADVLRSLGYQVKGANHRTVQRWARHWEISTAHFDPNIARRRANRARMKPLPEVLIEGSTYPRGTLNDTLLAAGIKQPICELCGQGDVWKSHPMSMVLDHINGISNDHRLENLRIVCPNCAATLETHCGRNLPRRRTCPGCGGEFSPRYLQNRYCSQKCWGTVLGDRLRGVPQPGSRKVPRPSYEQLMTDIETMSYLAVGRKYGVSDNAVRKWIRWYERGYDGPREAEAA
jgi:hypothetical protein